MARFLDTLPLARTMSRERGLPAYVFMLASGDHAVFCGRNEAEATRRARNAGHADAVAIATIYATLPEEV